MRHFVAMLIALELVSEARAGRHATPTVRVSRARTGLGPDASRPRAASANARRLLAGVSWPPTADNVIRAAAPLCCCCSSGARCHRSSTAGTTSRPSSRWRSSPCGGRGKALRESSVLILMSVFNGVLGTHQVLLNVVIPLWLVEETDAPARPPGLAVRHQHADGGAAAGAQLRRRRPASATRCGPAARRGLLRAVLRHRRGHARHGRVGHHRAGLGRPRDRDGRGALQSAGDWGLQAELSDPGRRGEYQASASSATPSARCGRRRRTRSWPWSGARPVAGDRHDRRRGSRRSLHPAAHAAERHLARAATFAVT